MELKTCYYPYLSKNPPIISTQDNLPFYHRRDKVSFDSNHQIIWTIDPNEAAGVIPTWKEFFLRQNEGVTKAKLWVEKIHPDDRENAVQLFCEAIVKKGPFAAEFRLQREDKSYLRLLVCGFPVLESDGRILEWIGTISRLSEAVSKMQTYSC